MKRLIIGYKFEKVLDTQKHWFSKKLKLESNKTQKFKTIARYLIFENLEDKTSYLLTQSTYNTFDDLEVDKIRKKKLWADFINL